MKENEYIEMTSMGPSPAGGDQPIPLSTVSSQLEMGKDYSNEPLPSPVALKAGKTGKRALFEIFFVFMSFFFFLVLFCLF